MFNFSALLAILVEQKVTLNKIHEYTIDFLPANFQLGTKTAKYRYHLVSIFGKSDTNSF